MNHNHFSAALVLLLFLTCPAGAIERCWPLDNSARILSSPVPNDIHPDWAGESYLGTSWSFAPFGYAGDHTGRYLRGDLYSPRGGLVNSDVYILAREWHCE